MRSRVQLGRVEDAFKLTLGLDRRPGSPDKQGMEKFGLDDDVTVFGVHPDPRGIAWTHARNGI
jgi:hypothetical protein